ncbi:hypothetical protein MM809_32320, partial [Klebsiella pneumoniae]|nr:hypothetical protein [Klebsiella pneumoniae]
MIPIKVILFSHWVLLWKRTEIANNPACPYLRFYRPAGRRVRLSGLGRWPEMLQYAPVNLMKDCYE